METKQKYCVFVNPKSEFGELGHLGFSHPHECLIKQRFIRTSQNSVSCCASFPNPDADRYRPLKAYQDTIARKCPLYSEDKTLVEKLVSKSQNLDKMRRQLLPKK